MTDYLTDILNAFILFCNFVFVPGVAYGSQLALGALGVTLVFGILRFANFAHGDTMAFGTMITIIFTWWFQSNGVSLGIFPTALLALPLGIVTTVFLMVCIDRTVYQFYRRKKSPPITLMMVSVGIMFMLAGFVRLIMGPKDQIFSDGERFIITAGNFKKITGLSEGIAIKLSQGLTIGMVILLVVFLFYFLYKTRTGKAMRAFSDNEDLALLSGISPDRVVIITWILAASLATIAGVLYGLDKSFKPLVYFQLLLPIFAAAIVGGIGQPVGAVVGGYVVAFSEVMITYAYKKFLIYLLPQRWEPDELVQLLSTDYKFAVSFTILVVILLVRPSGIFKGKTL